jgi:hypothetical protein
MAAYDSVGQYYLDSFGYGRLAVIKATALNTSGNGAVTGITLPILSGGLTNAGANLGSGQVIVRRVTVSGASGSVASANVSISATNDGANLITANTVLANITGTTTYQDLTIAQPYLSNTTVSGYTTQALFVNVNTVSGNANTVNIAVYGDVVNF